MQTLNITGYKFISLDGLNALREYFLKHCRELELKGTMLLSMEGINMSLAGTKEHIARFKIALRQDARFADISFRETFSICQPFKRLKIKIKREIITLRTPAANPNSNRAESIDPTTLKQWLDEKRDIILLDVRNDYEIEHGTFTGAMNLHLKHFGDFPKASAHIERNKPIVMFCTGGIRCEKAALYMMSEGFTEVYQLEGGILNYFNKAGNAHYQGECFVFDERVTLKA